MITVFGGIEVEFAIEKGERRNWGRFVELVLVGGMSGYGDGPKELCLFVRLSKLLYLFSL